MMAFLRKPAFRRLAAIVPAQRGASAVEFALLAPVLTLALLLTVDVGRALTEQMTIGSVLRTGAQSAIAGGDAATIGLSLNGSTADEALAVAVARICSCPENPQVRLDCSATCAGSAPTDIYYILSANKVFSGLLLPSLSLSRSLQVQVR
ncbi:TadE/TadG family type IV pilus assembly protein [Paracoccus salsus]|uniref:TadE/TadG family type IV pilus assembly protein n=1 Tax=Paracoccus salsus TaxID=2911061 RepID=UPI001F2CBDCC|nr:TadE/TadG family type IV pilus assembly protein [Paracoccus salsus]MCF3972586.1 pilus assembly protein [Paracoccus salsus]